MLNKHGNIQNFIGCDASYDDAKIVIFGAPFDSTTSNRPGARFGPAAIRNDSYGLETYSPYQDFDMDGAPIYDAGDIELPFGNPQPAMDAIDAAASAILGDGKVPVMLGGEHLLTYGAIRAALRLYPDLHIIHLDAHTDLRQDYLGEIYSHATVIRLCHEMLGDGKIHQFGIRSGTKEEFEWSVGRVNMQKYTLCGFNKLAQTLADAKTPVYFTLDLDVLDPSAFPGTGTPEAGGVSFAALLEAICALKQLKVVGCDVMELAPNLDTSSISTAIACKILRELLITLL